MTTQITRRQALVGATASAVVLTTGAGSILAGEGQVHDVTIKSFKFHPKSVVVKVGDIIRWTNVDVAPHTATAKNSGWDTSRISKNGSAMIEVTEGMETEYFCAFHPNMKGSIEFG